MRNFLYYAQKVPIKNIQPKLLKFLSWRCVKEQTINLFIYCYKIVTLQNPKNKKEKIQILIENNSEKGITIREV